MNYVVKFKNKITISFLIIGIFSISLLVTVSIFFNARQLEMNTLTIGDELVKSSANAISEYFNIRKTEISTYANMPLFQTMNWQKIFPYLKAEQARHKGIYEKMLLGLPHYPGNYYITTEGNPYYGGLLSFNNNSPNAKLKSIAKRDYWQFTAGNNPHAEARVYVSNPMVSYFTEVRQIMVAATILSKDKTKVLGMVSGSIAWKELDRLFNDINETILSRFGKEAKMFLVSHNGTYVYHYDEKKAIHILKDQADQPILNNIGEKETIGDKIIDESISELESAGNKLLSGASGNISFIDPKFKENMFLFYSPVLSAGYGLGMIVPERIIMQPLQKFYIILTFIALAALAFIILFSYLSAKKAAAPLKMFSQRAAEITEGNWNARIGYNIQDELGSVAHSFNHMISELQKHNEKVVESHERLLTILYSLDAKVYVTDMKSYKVLFINKTVKDTFGDVTGKICWQKLQKGQVGPCPFCTNNKLTDEKGEPAAPYIWECQDTSNGNWYHIIDRAVKWVDGRIVRLEISTDITAIKKSEEKIRHTHKMEAIGTLAGGIAHDFNNLLTVIIGYAESLNDELSKNSHQKVFIEKILKAGNRAKELVKQILTFSHRGEVTRQAIQPSIIIDEALKLMTASIPSTIEIKTNIDSECGTIMANPTNIHQIIMNLCTNALHAMENEKGILTITLTQIEIKENNPIKTTHNIEPGSYVELTVSDSGCGMDDAIIKRVFEPYFTTKKVGEGSGMGLAVVHGIVRSCGGFIDIESEAGKGTTVKVFIPVIEGKTEIIEAEPLKSYPLGNERILAVDDEDPIINMYKAMLEKHGYKVSIHNSSIKMLEEFRASPKSYDLVITDQTMPNISDAELAKEIQQIRPNIPIILCTGYSSVISTDDTQKMGIAGFIMKPFSKKELLITVREVLDKRKSQ